MDRAERAGIAEPLAQTLTKVGPIPGYRCVCDIHVTPVRKGVDCNRDAINKPGVVVQGAPR
jgi:hypothetical protein